MNWHNSVQDLPLSKTEMDCAVLERLQSEENLGVLKGQTGQDLRLCAMALEKH